MYYKVNAQINMILSEAQNDTPSGHPVSTLAIHDTTESLLNKETSLK